MSNQVKCLFGYHEYTIPYKKYPHGHICKCCRRFGYDKNFNGSEWWYELNEEGEVVYCKTSYACEYWYDKKRRLRHSRSPNEYEKWYDETGKTIKMESEKEYDRRIKCLM